MGRTNKVNYSTLLILVGWVCIICQLIFGLVKKDIVANFVFCGMAVVCFISSAIIKYNEQRSLRKELKDLIAKIESDEYQSQFRKGLD